jgi:hypothetical protein
VQGTTELSQSVIAAVTAGSVSVVVAPWDGARYAYRTAAGVDEAAPLRDQLAAALSNVER